jgi:hypothetical protein
LLVFGFQKLNSLKILRLSILDLELLVPKVGLAEAFTLRVLRGTVSASDAGAVGKAGAGDAGGD